MPSKMTYEAPRIYPTLRCSDAEAMIVWLKDVLGFTEHAVYRGDGVVQHAELAFGSAMIMLGQDRDDAYGQRVGSLDARRTDAIYVAVDDADALHEKVKASGAKIEMAPYDTDYGSRDFSCRDPEDNLWHFGTFWPKVDDTPMGE